IPPPRPPSRPPSRLGNTGVRASRPGPQSENWPPDLTKSHGFLPFAADLTEGDDASVSEALVHAAQRRARGARPTRDRHRLRDAPGAGDEPVPSMTGCSIGAPGVRRFSRGQDLNLRPLGL